MAKRQSLLNDRQIEILKNIAINGMKTKSELQKEFKVKYPAIVGSMAILQEKKMVKIVSTEKGRGRAKLFYGITDKGLTALSKDHRISIQEFWTIAFLIYDVKTNSNISLSLEEYCSNYEREILGYDIEYAIMGWGIVLDHFSILYPAPDKKSPKMSILYEIGIHGKQTSKQIEKNVNIESKEKINIEGLLEDMERSKNILQNGSKYQISSFGFLLLMNYMEKTKSNHLEKNTSKDFTKIVKTIMENAEAVPLISKNWKVLREIINELNITQFFARIANNAPPLSNSVQLGGIQELITAERTMGDAYKNIISRENRIGLNTVSKIFKERKIKPESNRVFQRLLYLGIIDGFGVQDQKKFLRKVKGKDFVLDNIINKAIANKISFEFFTYFIDWVIGERGRAGDVEEIKTDRIAKWHYSTVKKWNKFQKSNKEFRKWYNAWVDEIRMFEERNTKILKERNFLEIK